MINWQRFTLKYKDKEYTLSDLCAESGCAEVTMQKWVREYKRGKRTKKSLFKPPRNAWTRLSNGEFIDTKQFVLITGITDSGLRASRFSSFRKGEISEETFLSPRIDPGSSKRMGKHVPPDIMTPEREEAFREMTKKTNSPPFLRQDEIFPLYETPNFQKAR